jgi:hypothetical protein
MWSALAGAALACGGFFCDNAAPVQQAGEQIVFAVGGGTVEMHVQVQYTGPAEEFSWLLPVPELPELLLSTNDLFVRLGQVTAPQYVPTLEQQGRCYVPVRLPGNGDSDKAEDDSAADDGGVSVVEDQQVGPYDAQILTADDVSALTTWLVDNGYDLAPGAEDKLAGYVQEGGYFVGLKLRKDRGVGDLAPVALRFSGTDPMIPLALTAVAVTDDMPLQPYVLGSARAVPENYLHVRVNPFAVDWMTRGSNYPDVVSRAADEAGGQAFATDFAGDVSSTGVALWAPGQYPIAQIAQVTDSHTLDRYLAQVFPSPGGDVTWMSDPGALPLTSGTIPILARFVPSPFGAGSGRLSYLQCLSCFDPVPVDGAALAAEWEQPMRDAQALLNSHPWLTRLTSSLSADEMTVDPRFVLNPELPAVSNVHGAVIRTRCDPSHQVSGAPRELILDDGRAMALPSAWDWARGGWTWEEWAGEAGGYAAEVVEQVGRSGQPTVVTDNRAAIDGALVGLDSGCGCDGTGRASGSTVAVLAALLAAHRRRRGVGSC